MAPRADWKASVGRDDDAHPAKRAGLEPGDIIVTADGTPVDRVSTLQRLIRTHQPGDVLTLEAVRYGDHKTFKVTLAEAPGSTPEVASSRTSRNNDNTDAAGAMTSGKLGITVEPLAADAMKNANSATPLHGVVVREVQRGGAAEGQLTAGDVITDVIFPQPRAAIRSTADLQKALSGIKHDGYVGLLISRQSDAQGNRTTAVVNLHLEG